jgi:hypothetical protein
VKYSHAWSERPGGAGAARLRRLRRPQATQDQYDPFVKLWLEWNDLGHLGQPYDPMLATPDKFELFAGWLLGADGEWGRSRNKDLNMIRSALNRFFDDNQRGRPLKGTDVATMVTNYRGLMVAKKKAAGIDADLHRVPCPEAALLTLIALGQSAVGENLNWIANLLLQLIGWFRADTMAGLRAGDVTIDNFGHLNVLIRHMKFRPAYRTQPGLMTIPPGPADQPLHARNVVFAILRRAMDADPSVFSMIGRRVSPSETNGAAAAQLVTDKLRELVDIESLNLPVGATVSSHSFREMGATAAAKAGYDSIRMAAHGHWREIATMYNSYIKPFLDAFPFSLVLAELNDFLRST